MQRTRAGIPANTCKMQEKPLNISTLEKTCVRNLFKNRSMPPPLTADKINYHCWQKINGSNVQNCVITAAAELDTTCHLSHIQLCHSQACWKLPHSAPRNYRLGCRSNGWLLDLSPAGSLQVCPITFLRFWNCQQEKKKSLLGKSYCYGNKINSAISCQINHHPKAWNQG